MDYRRELLKTHFITTKDSLDEVVSKYVVSIAQEGDIVIFCEKIISIMQGRVVYKKDIHLSFWAKFLSRFVTKNSYGFAVGDPHKMQVAINESGLIRIIFASIIGGFSKLFGLKGVFYILAGNQVSEIDGFHEESFKEYKNMGILGSKDTSLVCEKLKKQYGFSCAVVDINDIGGNIIGISSDILSQKQLILDILADNPAGQSNAQTPIIIIKKIT